MNPVDSELIKRNPIYFCLSLFLSMEDRPIIYGLIVVIIITLVISVTQINFLSGEVNNLENKISELQSSIDNREGIIESLSAQIEDMEEILTTLETDLIISRENNTKYISEIETLNATLLEMQSDFMILEEAIDIIGREEVRTVLIRYGETTAKLEGLQADYAKLLSQYNSLLKQLEE
jgi:chromosome segregation ATPase